MTLQDTFSYIESLIVHTTSHKIESLIHIPELEIEGYWKKNKIIVNDKSQLESLSA